MDKGTEALIHSQLSAQGHLVHTEPQSRYQFRQFDSGSSPLHNFQAERWVRAEWSPVQEGRVKSSWGQVSEALGEARPSPHWLVCLSLIHPLCLWLSPTQLSAKGADAHLILGIRSRSWRVSSSWPRCKAGGTLRAHTSISGFLNVMQIPNSIPRFLSVIHRRSRKLRQACQHFQPS